MLSNEEIQNFLTENTAKNTSKKTATDMKVFYRWMKESLPSENRQMEDIPPAELNQILRTFFVKVRKQDGEQYEPGSIKAMQNSFERYLTEKDYDVSLLSGHVFKGSRVVLTAKRKQLKHEGYGRKPNRAQALSEEEEEVLWSSGQLGMHNARSLQNAVWWRNNFFGMRGRTEHRDMKWGDILVQTDTDGLQYLEYYERDTKTRKDPRQERSFTPRIYATPETPERCPVKLLIEFTHKRPAAMLDPESPFYLAILSDKQIKPHTWYKSCPLGEHSLGDLMKNMCSKAGLSTKFTNHSGRKTTVKRLREADVESSDIIQLTGHKNIQSVNSYSDVSLKKQKEMSNILVHTSKRNVDQVLPNTTTTLSSTGQRSATVRSLSSTAQRSATVSSLSSTAQRSVTVGSLSSTEQRSATVSTLASSAPTGYDFDPEDGFEDAIALIEDYELQNVPQGVQGQSRSDLSNTVMPQSSFSNCSFNFTLNFTR